MGGVLRLVACSKCHTQFDGAQFAGATFRCSCGETVSNVEHQPIDALVHRCSACGAAVPPDAVHCEYCQGAIVRDQRQMGLICPECYARNPTAAKYCTGCGVEFCPQPIDDGGPALVCPADGETDLVARAVGGVLIHECPNCAGLWVPGDAFDHLVQKAVAAQTARASTGLGGDQGPAHRWTGGGKVRYRKCPCCGGIMNRKNFGGGSGILVDWCGVDGTWLDADELEEIAAYIMEGGLVEPVGPGGPVKRGIHPRHPHELRALAESERLLAEARGQRAKKKGAGSGFSLGDFLSTLLEL